MKRTKTIPSRALVKRFHKSFIKTFHQTITKKYVERPFTESTFEEVVSFVIAYNFSKELVDSNSKKPVKLYLSRFKGGIYDLKRQRFTAVREYIFTNINQEQTQEDCCHNPGIKRMTGECHIIIPFKDRLKECWLSISLLVL